MKHNVIDPYVTSDGTPTGSEDNILDMLEQAQDLLQKSTRAWKENRPYYEARAKELFDTARAYAKQFKVKFPFPCSGELADLRKWSAAQYKKAQAEQEAKQAKEREERVAKGLAELADWQANVPGRYRHVMYLPDDYLRVTGDTVESSRGCRVPLDQVRDAIPLVIRVIRSGETWTGSVQLGPYQLRAVTREHVIVGCHRFTRAEILRFAAVLDEMASEVVAQAV